MKVVRAKDEHVEKIQDLLLQVLMVHYHGRPDLFKPYTRKYTDEEVKKIIKDDTTPVFVCLNDQNEVVGHAFCIFQQYLNSNNLTDVKTLYIDDICVDEAHRHEGIGTALYEGVMAFAKQQKVYNVTLNVYACNQGAKEFYEKMGFKPMKYGMEVILGNEE